MTIERSGSLDESVTVTACVYLQNMSSNAIESAQFAENRSPAPTNGSTPKIDVDKLTSLVARLSANSLKKQLLAIRELAALDLPVGSQGEDALAAFVRDRMSKQNSAEPTAAHGSAYQLLYDRVSQGKGSEAAQALIEDFPDGLVCPQSDKNVDYQALQMLLVRKEYELADKLTNQKLCELAGASAVERKWVYFTEVSQIPIIDLQAIDLMWGLYSEDKFGWQKQRDLWVRLGQDWERLWIQLLWKSTGGTWTRYPNEFVWNLETAPPAHLPLSNQLRGVRTMSSLLSHPAWGPSAQG